jgi:HAD superfamily hydrolase (TIGR01549 family)
MPGPVAVIFDFDGVILESVDLKARAFRQLFQDYPEHVDDIVRLHLEQGGLSRYEKFRRIFADYLRLPLSAERMARLDQEYRALVLAEMLTCPYVPGAREFIERHAVEVPLFIASGTPETELREIATLRGLSPYFAGVYGSPRPKVTLLRHIAARVAARPNRLVFVGDSLPDYEAAVRVGIPLIGRVPSGQPSPFPRNHVPLIRDLVALEEWWSTC